MPAHIGTWTKLKLFGACVAKNLDPRDSAKIAREKRVDAKELRLHQEKRRGDANNRAEYLPYKYVLDTAMVVAQRRREKTFFLYDVLRAYLDNLDPAKPYTDGALYTDRKEWDLYLRPGTQFDWLLKVYFASKLGQVMVIVHKSDRLKVKRIEAHPRNGEVVILWSDAS